VINDLEAKEKAGGMGKDDAFRLKKDMQKIVDDANKKLDEAYGRKEKEILG
jgi:ribosome recycling factor